MTELVFLLEEPSAKAMLEGLMPRLAPDVPARYLVFQGKQDLERQLVLKLRHYQNPGARFIVLRDQDSADCHEVKRSLVAKCKEAKREALVRIACHELESWYLADLAAVESGLEMKGLAAKQGLSKYREPDRLANAAEELAKVTIRRYQKVGGSRSIGQYLDTSNTRSKSFAVFIAGVKNLAINDMRK